MSGILATGPVRLVLLNAGKYEHADVELDRSLHLAGPNNIGKTTLVNTLQFLYIDDARAMHFADKTLDETRRYYFPGLHSYVLFECLCRDRRFRVVGLRGLGPAKAYAWERFVVDGPYALEDFADPQQRLREPEVVLARLALKGYRVLEPRELRAALIGDGLDNVPPLGLLPLRNRSDYERFRTLFGNLLRLAHLRQDDLKRLFVDAHAADFRQPEIRLAADFAQSYRTVQRQKREVDALTEIEADARLYLQRHQSLRDTCAALVGQWRQIDERTRSVRALQQTALTRIQEERSKHELAVAQTETELVALRGTRDAVMKRLGAIDAELAQRDRLAQLWGAVLPELETAARDNLAGLHDHLRQSLANVAGRSAAAIARERGERERERHLRIAEQAALAHNLAGWLKTRVSDADLDRLFRLLSPALLGLPRGSDGIDVRQADALAARLNALAEQLASGVYADAQVQVQLAALPAPDLARYADPQALAEAILALDRDLQRLAAEHRAALDSQRGAQELAELAAKLAACQARLVGHQHWQEVQTRLRPLAREHRDLDKQLIDIEQQSAKISERVGGLRNAIAAGERERAEHEREGRALEKALHALTPPAPEWPSPATPTADSADWRVLVESYVKQSGSAQTLSHLLDDARGRLARALPRLAVDEGFADALAQELDGLGEKRVALGEAWRGFIAGLTAAFDAQLADLDRLRVRIDALNRLLKQAQVSDLKELRLGLRELPESCGLIKQFVEQHKASAGADLFADRVAFARAEQRVGEFLEQRGTLELTELFQLEFEVTRANGVVTRYPHLDRIESNGTSITIKVLTLLTLLRGLMREREGYRMPFFLDEANALDRANLRAIVRLAESFGFTPVLASPDGSDAAARVYVPMRLPNGRVVLTGRHALTLERADASAQPSAAPAAD